VRSSRAAPMRVNGPDPRRGSTRARIPADAANLIGEARELPPRVSAGAILSKDTLRFASIRFTVVPGRARRADGRAALLWAVPLFETVLCQADAAPVTARSATFAS
jgi:hypothetical protein